VSLLLEVKRERATAERVIYSGEPGTFWRNDTGMAQYQFIAALDHTCGVCLQYHTKIAAGWGMPFQCGCKNGSSLN
jgi:hypothetical protein